MVVFFNKCLCRLFGVFNHDIKLNLDDGITIIIGENGLGKTIVLEAINALFNQNYEFFCNLDFDGFDFYFDNGDVWQLTKNVEEENTSLLIGRTSTSKPVKKVKTYKFYQYSEQLSRKILRDEREHIRRMEIERGYRFHNQNRLSMSSYELAREYEYKKKMESLYHRRFMHEDNFEVKSPKWFNSSIKNIKVKFIETQRIMTAKEIGRDSYVNNLSKCSKELQDLITLASRESSRVASELDSTYPNRLVTQLKQDSRYTFNNLNGALAKLDDRRKSFSLAGLTVKKSDSDLLKIEEKQKSLVDVLKLYIDDSHKKLEPFEELSKKIILFKKIINKRFKHKKLEINSDEGLVFRSMVVTNDTGEFETIESSKLSSGEQNELVL